MAVLSVRKYGDPALRRRAELVGAITADIRVLAADMIDTMYEEIGIGLAAPQVGVAVRMIVVADAQTRDTRVLIDPVITADGGEATAEEGCLSLPGVFAPVTRRAWVVVEARDLDDRTIVLDAKGLLARVLQHEMDHLDGVLFIDHVDPVTRDRIKRKIKKEGLPDDVGHRAFAL